MIAVYPDARPSIKSFLARLLHMQASHYWQTALKPPELDAQHVAAVPLSVLDIVLVSRPAALQHPHRSFLCSGVSPSPPPHFGQVT